MGIAELVVSNIIGPSETDSFSRLHRPDRPSRNYICFGVSLQVISAISCRSPILDIGFSILVLISDVVCKLENKNGMVGIAD